MCFSEYGGVEIFVYLIIFRKQNNGIFDFPIPINKLCLLIKLVREDSYFSFDNVIYRQIFGFSVSCSLLPILANLFMEVFETVHVPRIIIPDLSLVMWKRYVDDIFAFLNPESLGTYLDCLNNIVPTIKFTVEESKDMSLLFLDVSVKTNQVNKNFSTAIFRKATHTDNYINFLSYHSNNIKKIVMTGFSYVS